MYAIRSYYGKQNGECNRNEQKDPRITSYNVCYTKLLRNFDAFCDLYEISKREAEIVTEICNGLTNKAIADKLFITLQTVKDHNHRIFTKTGVKSRVQLTRITSYNVCYTKLLRGITKLFVTNMYCHVSYSVV